MARFPSKSRSRKASACQLENDFLKQVIEYAKLRGWRTAHFRPGMMANGRWITAGAGDWKGFPDLAMVRGGRLIFAELKTNKGRVSKEQRLWIDAIFGVGVCGMFVWRPRDWKQIEEVLQ